MKLMPGRRHFNGREDNPSLLGPPALVSFGIYLVSFFYECLLDGFPWVLVWWHEPTWGYHPTAAPGRCPALVDETSWKEVRHRSGRMHPWVLRKANGTS